MTRWASGAAGDGDPVDDVVGTASARLLAAGVPRGDRLGALRVLGLLSDSADESGRVRRPFDDLVAEFDLPAAEAHAWLAALVEVDIARPDGQAIQLAGVEPPAPGGLRLADFLATAQAMDAAGAAPPGREAEPAGAPVPARATAGARPAGTEQAADPVEAEPVVAPFVPPPARRRPRLTRPLPALAAAAAVVAALATVPLLGRDDRAALPVASGSAGPTETTTETPTTVGRDVPRRPGTTTSTSAAAREERLPVVTPEPPTSTTLVAGPCPVGEPLVRVLEVTGGATEGLRRVDGTIANGSDAPMQVDAITVTVTLADQVLEVPVLAAPLALPPGTTVRWSTTVPVAGLQEVGVDAAADEWRWDDPATEQRCP